MLRPTLSPTRAKSIVSRCFLQVTKFGAQWPIQSRPAEVGRLLFAMLAPQCCALMIAPARKDRFDNGLEAPGQQGRLHTPLAVVPRRLSYSERAPSDSSSRS